MVRGLGDAALGSASVGGPPDVAGVGPPDGRDHARVEEDQEDDRDEEKHQE